MLEACSVVSWRYFEDAKKRASHRVDAPESAIHRDAVKGRTRRFQSLPRFLHSHQFHMLPWSPPDILQEYARAISGTHIRACRKRFDREILVQVFRRPAQEIAQQILLVSQGFNDSHTSRW